MPGSVVPLAMFTAIFMVDQKDKNSTGMILGEESRILPREYSAPQGELLTINKLKVKEERKNTK